mgnify:CR=1 FL=1
MRTLYRAAAATALMVALLVTLSACTEFERASWVAIRDADAALEQATVEWEGWKAADPQVFSAGQLENIRTGLFAANESLSAAERSFTTYRSTKKLFWEGKATEQDVKATQEVLVRVIEDVKSAVASVQAVIITLRQKDGQAALILPVNQAAVSSPMLLMLLNLFGQLAGSLVRGKKGLITSASVNVIAAVLKVHKQATNEDIDLALPALRKRIEERRKRLAA